MDWDSRKFNKVKQYLYDKTGFQLVKVNRSYKLQVPQKELITITKNDSPLTYKTFLLIVAYMITKEVGEYFPRKDLYEEIQSEMGNLSVNEKQSLFKSALLYMIKQGFLKEEKLETDGLEDEVRLLKKLKEVYTSGLSEQYPLSKLAKITNHLFLNGTMDKRYHKNLWFNLSNDDLAEYFEQFHNEESTKGFDVLFDGDLVRLLTYSDSSGFPNLDKMEHRILVDMLAEGAVSSDLEIFREAMKSSKHYRDSVKVEDLQAIVKQYDLETLKVKKTERSA